MPMKWSTDAAGEIVAPELPLSLRWHSLAGDLRESSPSSEPGGKASQTGPNALKRSTGFDRRLVARRRKAI